jgi:F-type H+-transporting ATPase subunit epsilon
LADDLNLEIISPDSQIFKDKVESITIPGTAGSFQVLRNHAPLISTFEIGIIKIKKSGSEASHYTTSGGTVEVNQNKILVLSDSIEKVENIDVNRAELARKRAEERLGEKNKETIDVVRAEAALHRAINRINACQKYLN